MTIFVDRNGLISGKVIGELDERLLAIQLERILPKAR